MSEKVSITKTKLDSLANAIASVGETSVPKTIAQMESAVLELTIPPNLQSKTITPSITQQIVSPDSGYDAFSQVTVNAIELQEKTITPTTEQQIVTPDNSLAGRISVGTTSTFYNGNTSISVFTIENQNYIANATYSFQGKLVGSNGGVINLRGSKTGELGAVNLESNTNYTYNNINIEAIAWWAELTATAREQFLIQVGSGYSDITWTVAEEVIITNDAYETYDGLSKVTVNAMPSGTAGTPTATKGTVSNHSISVTPSVTNTTGYITGGTINGTPVTVNASELVSGTKSITSSGTTDVTDYASVSVAEGSATTPTTSITANPTISVSSGGLITAAVSATKSITPTVSVGYVSSGTTGTATVSGSATEQLTTQAAQTIHPSTTDQTITSGKYLTGAQTVKGVTLTNLIAGNIKKDVVVKIGDSTDDDCVTSITGTYGDIYDPIYKSLAYRSVIASYASYVSEWCNSLSRITSQQFAGQPFSGNFVFNNVSYISASAFGSVFTSLATGAAYAWNCSFPSCTTIGQGAFYYNTGIKEVYFPNCTSISSYAFQNCKLTAVSFPKCTSIGYSAFQYCSTLTTVSFPSCNIISYYAFANCYSLSNISFPECTSIGYSAFTYCSALTTVSFPKCTFIGSSAFQDCRALVTASFPECTTIASSAFADCYSLSNISFPKCTTIKEYAFQNCSALVTASFPSCTSIGARAFSNCYSLSNISFPNCTSIDISAFYNCSALVTANFPSCTIINNYAFYSCSALKTASFASCTSIGSSAFYSCSALTTVSFPNCNIIGSQAFQNCSALTTVSFPKCTSIKDYAFRYCTKLSRFYFMGSSIPSISLYTFVNTPLSLSSYLGYYGSIYVPTSLLASYKTATYWAQYSARMVGV